MYRAQQQPSGWYYRCCQTQSHNTHKYHSLRPKSNAAVVVVVLRPPKMVKYLWTLKIFRFNTFSYRYLFCSLFVVGVGCWLLGRCWCWTDEWLFRFSIIISIIIRCLTFISHAKWCAAIGCETNSEILDLLWHYTASSHSSCLCVRVASVTHSIGQMASENKLPRPVTHKTNKRPLIGCFGSAEQTVYMHDFAYSNYVR